MHTALDDHALDQLFRQARSHHAWLDIPVSPDTLRQLYELTMQGPTSANSLPARFVFVQGQEAKARLLPFLAPGNVEQTLAAPVTVIVAQDHDFPEHLPRLYPHTDARSWFAGNEIKIAETAFRNSSLQGAYLILAARALGLDAGPMSGFDNAGVDAVFFAGTRIRSNFLVNLGHGDHSRLHPRGPRPDFAAYASIL
ncbi:MAG: malonic semialdehyde reductase [Perlucidibaca sp.]